MITPTQEDIKAARAIWHMPDDGPYCETWLVQAFAQHAARAAERMRERCAEAVVDHCRACNAAGKEASFLDAVAAIRAIPTTEVRHG